MPDAGNHGLTDVEIFCHRIWKHPPDRLLADCVASIVRGRRVSSQDAPDVKGAASRTSDANSSCSLKGNRGPAACAGEIGERLSASGAVGHGRRRVVPTKPFTLYGLKVSVRQPRKGWLWLNDGSCVRLRPE